MAEAALISTISEHVTKILYEEGKRHVKLLTGFDEEVKKLKENLNTTRLLLQDAEEKQLADERIKIWLNNLKDVYYNMDDVLDEWHTFLLKLKYRRGGEEVAKNASATFMDLVRSLPSCCYPTNFITRHKTAVKIQWINARLDKVTSEKDKFQLTTRKIRQHPRSSETTSFAYSTKLFGRDEIVEKMVDSLCGDVAEHKGCNLQTISIVGMGGMGKTALAQKIFNKSRVNKCFDKRIWVCVSNLFEITRVAKAIIAALEGQDLNPPLQGILERICTAIDGKRFFLVLDDVWTENDRDFESLMQTFKYGAPGSKILVTTRKDGVAKMMKSLPTLYLKELADECCWQVLSQAASFERRGKEERENLEGIGRDIANKCKGLPLAAMTLGSLLREKISREEWENVLKSEVWSFDLFQKDVFAPLLLSYYDLPPKVRPCFLYCATFPKDFVINKIHLINLWMGMGYLNSDENPEMEAVGKEYFDHLASRSFFQDFVYINSEVVSCTMHDTLHDFACYLAKDEVITNHVGPSDKGPIHVKARALGVMAGKGVDFPSSVSGIEELRSLLAFSDHKHTIGEALRNIIMTAKRLRVLGFDFKHTEEFYPHTLEVVPSEIGKLKHLRYLKLNNIWYTYELPETICDLINLLHLNVEGCIALKSLPEGIGKLINLRLINTKDCYSITSYPKGVRKLTSLREALNVRVRTDVDDPQVFSLADLGKLTELRQLGMILKGDGIDIGEARKAELDKKHHLHYLKIDTIDLCKTVKRDQVIESLHPPAIAKIDYH